MIFQKSYAHQGPVSIPEARPGHGGQHTKSTKGMRGFDWFRSAPSRSLGSGWLWWSIRLLAAHVTECKLFFQSSDGYSDWHQSTTWIGTILGCQSSLSPGTRRCAMHLSLRFRFIYTIICSKIIMMNNTAVYGK